ncbi:MAG: hypothetical protein UHU21_08275 [Lachnospiraceae bacterium]|nr:hypothetical protein [Lachnospiraceae bacterium]
MTHRTPRTIRYRGRAYDSWQALADDYGLSVFCTRNRIDRGIPLDLPKQKNGAWVFKPVEYDGRKYPSMHALAEAYGLDVWGARYRLTLGVPLTVKGTSWRQELWKLI